MKYSLTLAVLVLSCAQALAIGRYDISGMSCDEVRAVVKRDGAAILRYPSRRVPGLPLYSRYVAHGGYCDASEYAVFTTVPARDNPQCPVLFCREKVDVD